MKIRVIDLTNLLYLWACAALLIFCSSMAEADDSSSPSIDGDWSVEGVVYGTGNRLEHEGFSSEAWVPYETDSHLVWAIDTCLGFFQTRDKSLLSDQPIEFPTQNSIRFWNIEKTAAINLMNFPFNEYGVFDCHWRSHLYPDHLWTKETINSVTEWVEFRMAGSNGWSGNFGPENPRSVAEFRNERMGVTLRVLIGHENYPFDIRADYHGPPFVMR